MNLETQKAKGTQMLGVTAMGLSPSVLIMAKSICENSFSKKGECIAGRGLWADAKALPPWEWRASEKNRQNWKKDGER